MSTTKISTHRSSIMGISIIMIIIFHTDIFYPHILKMIKNLGDFGVNQFLAISGFSMCYAWRKCPDVGTFLKNRFLRIGITILPITILWNIYVFLNHEITLFEAICTTLTIQFWINGNTFQWFVSGILVLYLITPFWMNLYDQNKILCYLLSIAISIVCLILPLINLFTYIMCFMQRVPAYFIGLYLGKHAIENKQDTKTMRILLWVSLLIGVAGFASNGFYTMDYKWKYILYSVLTYPVLMLLTYLFEIIPANKKGILLPFLGAITLEIYLFQEKILKLSHIIFGTANIMFDKKNIVINIIVITATILIGFFYHKITDVIYKKLRTS